MKHLFLPGLILISAGSLFSQSLFDSAVSDTQPASEQQTDGTDSSSEAENTRQTILSGSPEKS